mgnify:CR=1 FL=1
MKLALVLGDKQGSVVKPRLQGIKDNLNIDCFDNIPSFIDMAIKRNAIYDRILVLSTKINTATLKDLNNYWSATSKETEIVLLCKSGVDDDKARDFLDTFMTPVACAMLVDSTPVSIIAEGVLRPVAELNNDYGIKDFLDMEVDDDAYIPEEPKVEDSSTTIIQQQPQASVQQSQQQAQQIKKPEKKKGFFSSIFGSRKQIQQQQTIQPQSEQQVIQNEPMQQVAQNEPMQQVVQVEPIQSTNDDINMNQSDYNQSENLEQNLNVQDSADSSYSDYEETEPIIKDDFSDFQENLADNVTSMMEESQPSDMSLTDTQSTDFEESIKKPELNPNTQSSLGSNSFEPEFEEVTPVKNDFEPEQIEIDDDFGTEDLDYDQSQDEVHYSISSPSEIDEDVNDMGVALDEEQYRQQTEQPKVIKQVITKEVIRNVNTGNKLVALNGVYQGRLKKVVIVTGDRGTGVTSTALNIAKTLAKKVDVLYFDCDINNHGLLNYIDYANFKNYEQVHMNGVKMCKSTQVFSNCVISWEENLYLLTTDFSCDCSTEDLERAGEVVAENADEFGVVVVDCPVDKLPYIKDLVLTGLGVVCVEGSRRGFMNMLCQFEANTLQTRYKRTLVSHGIMLVTKCNKHLDLKKLVNYIKAIYEPDEVNWLAHEPIAFNGNLTDKLLNDILEG